MTENLRCIQIKGTTKIIVLVLFTASAFATFALTSLTSDSPIVTVEEAEAHYGSICNRQYVSDACYTWKTHTKTGHYTCSPWTYHGIKPAGTSCNDRKGTCNGGITCVSNPDVTTASAPASIDLGNTLKISGSTDSPKFSTPVNIKIFVDNAEIGQCGPLRGSSCRTVCYQHSVRFGCQKSRSICVGINENRGSCRISYTPSLSGTYSYYAQAVSRSGQKSTSLIGTFNVTEPCNNNNVCDGLETASKCPLECLIGSEFSMSIDPTLGIANKGDVKDVNVSVTITGSGYVRFSAENLPPGTTATFNPDSCGGADCYSNATITTTALTPEGSSLIAIKASSEVEKSSTYNLTVLTDNVSVTCGDLACGYPETQSSCVADCKTIVSIVPSIVSPGQSADVTVEFHDFRYQAGGKVRIDLTINPEGIKWTPSNGCFFGGKNMEHVASSDGTIQWPPGTVSEDGHFKISTTCTLPGSISFRSHTLLAVPSIF